MTPEERLQVINLLVDGTCTLIIGDVSETNSRPSLELLKRAALTKLGENEEASLPLLDVFQALHAQDPAAAEGLTRTHLSRKLADTTSMVRILGAPWDEIYSIGGTPFEDIDFSKLRNRIERIPAAAPPPPSTGGTLFVDEAPIQSGDEPITRLFMEAPQASPLGQWQQKLEILILRRPCVMVTRGLNDYFWKRLQKRTSTTDSPTIIVVENILAEDRLKAIRHRITLIPGTLEDLATALPPGDHRIKQGRVAQERRRKHEQKNARVHTIGALEAHDEADSGWNFLKGFDPQWSDVSNKRLVDFDILRKLKDSIRITAAERNVVILSGRSGSGKTAALMQLAHHLHSSGSLIVAWIDRNTQPNRREILDEIDLIEPDCVFVDDVDMFGEKTPSLIRDLNRNGKVLVVAAVRTTMEQYIGTVENTARIHEKPLTDRDIDRLERALAHAGLLGELQGVHPRSTRLDKIQSICKRDLLAALIEIVSGRPFEQRVTTEFAQLQEVERNVYLTVVIFVSCVNEARRMTDTRLLQAVAHFQPIDEASQALDTLLRMKLLVADDRGIGVRHRAISDALVETIERERIAQVIKSLLQYYATIAGSISDATHPDRRTMVSLLSHTLMVKLNLATNDVRDIYESVRPMLHADFHYWLQAGSYETEKGDDEQAVRCLRSARSLPNGANDYKVNTEWGILCIRRSMADPGNHDKAKTAASAIREMVTVTKINGSNSPHTFKVLAGDADKFVARTQILSEDERDGLRELLDQAAALGARVCVDNSVAIQAVTAYQKRRLSEDEKAPVYSFPVPQEEPPRRPSPSPLDIFPNRRRQAPRR